MIKPYYQDDYVTLYHGDSLEILPALDIKADVLLTDPPYFKVKQEEWDNQWDKASEFLGWMGDFLDIAKPLLAANASAWVFASPAMTSSVERLVGERFRVLNSIRWIKQYGWHQKASLPSLRSFLTPWEGVVFAEVEPALPAFANYIRDERQRAGLSQLDVARNFPSATGGFSGTAYNWEKGLSLPVASDYERLRALMGAGFLSREHEEIATEYACGRRVFNVTKRETSTDVWSFPTVMPYPGKHPCEKPAAMLLHMIESSSNPGGMVLDPFAGSGSTLLAASNAGRMSVGIEKDERWCEHAASRLSQGTLELEWTA